MIKGRYNNCEKKTTLQLWNYEQRWRQNDTAMVNMRNNGDLNTIPRWWEHESAMEKYEAPIAKHKTTLKNIQNNNNKKWKYWNHVNDEKLN
jgi:hypothetical protein